MTANKNSSNTKKLLGVGILAVLIAAFALIYAAFGAKPTKGSKVITIEVVNSTEESVEYEIQTDAEFLRQAMEEAEGLAFSGIEGDYGLMIDTVNGERADYTLDGAYWSFLINGESCNYGIDSQPINDGDAFAIVYTPAQ